MIHTEEFAKKKLLVQFLSQNLLKTSQKNKFKYPLRIVLNNYNITSL